MFRNTTEIIKPNSLLNNSKRQGLKSAKWSNQCVNKSQTAKIQNDAPAQCPLIKKVDVVLSPGDDLLLHWITLGSSGNELATIEHYFTISTASSVYFWFVWSSTQNIHHPSLSLKLRSNHVTKSIVYRGWFDDQKWNAQSEIETERLKINLRCTVPPRSFKLPNRILWEKQNSMKWGILFTT